MHLRIPAGYGLEHTSRICVCSRLTTTSSMDFASTACRTLVSAHGSAHVTTVDRKHADFHTSIDPSLDRLRFAMISRSTQYGSPLNRSFSSSSKHPVRVLIMYITHIRRTDSNQKSHTLPHSISDGSALPYQRMGSIVSLDATYNRKVCLTTTSP